MKISYPVIKFVLGVVGGFECEHKMWADTQSNNLQPTKINESKHVTENRKL